MPYYIDESNVDDYIEKLKQRSKTDYIIQSVSFRKDNKEEMQLLRKMLLDHPKFARLVKDTFMEIYNHHKTEIKPLSHEKQKEPIVINNNFIQKNKKETSKVDVSSWM
ncbi:MAG: hypothetical protein IRZ03_19035 [Acidobacterium ailaaui]|nr:hypothetical protein [Pseudacidobacterium ailaaui]